MGRHGKPGLWSKLTPEQKADEFDDSHDDPRGYAEEHFGAGKKGRQTSWAKKREQQIKGKESEK